LEKADPPKKDNLVKENKEKPKSKSKSKDRKVSAHPKDSEEDEHKPIEKKALKKRPSTSKIIFSDKSKDKVVD